jgi:hypothetical protein
MRKRRSAIVDWMLGHGGPSSEATSAVQGKAEGRKDACMTWVPCERRHVTSPLMR